MKHRGWLWFAGISTVLVGCSGGVLKGNADSGPNISPGDEATSGSASVAPTPSGHGGAPACADDANASLGGEAGIGSAGEAGAENANEACIAGECRSTRTHAASSWDFECPRELCDARVMASNCSALPGGALKTSALDCWDDHVLLFEISPTRRKACYYGSTTSDGPSFLVGATVWDDEANFCDGRAAKLTGGNPRDIESCDDMPFVTTLCDVANPETAPDCSNKPENYPGYSCTPDTPDDESYCSCECQEGEWSCAC